MFHSAIWSSKAAHGRGHIHNMDLLAERGNRIDVLHVDQTLTQA